jgi:hypothetical protein
MTLFEICQWIQDTKFGTDLRESQYMFPIVESIHVLGLGASVGLILWTDLRLVGAALRREPAIEVHEQMKPWMLTGFVVMMLSGALLFWSEAAKLYGSNTFRAKLIFLAIAGINALVFETREARTGEVRRIELGSLPLRARLAGWVSLIAWTGVIVFGRWTAYGLK